MIENQLSNRELQLVRMMDSLTQRILNPGERRIYDLLIEGVGPFTDLFDLEWAGCAYQVWAAIGDLVDAPWGPHSDAACETTARAAAADWLAIDRSKRESIDDFFRAWLARV